MSPARIVAVTRLLLDVLEDLGDREMDQMTEAEADLAMLFVAAEDQLRGIHATALKEMQELAPRVLAEAYPAPG